MSFFKKLFSGGVAKQKDKVTGFSVGDIFYVQADGKYLLYKLLAVDVDSECYHVLTFSPLDSVPTSADIDNLLIFAHHSPFDKKAFLDAILLANKPVRVDDLVSYHEYLRQTQSPDYCAFIANNYYLAGLQLTDKRKHYEAIDSYSKSIDLLPHFFEAIDNRAFCKMDLGLWAEAIEDFKLSLQQNPNSVLAEFSIGECYFKMGDFQNAKRQFEIAHNIDPSDQSPRLFLEKVNEILKQ